MNTWLVLQECCGPHFSYLQHKTMHTGGRLINNRGQATGVAYAS